MAPPTAAKKKKQEVMLKHRVSNGSLRVDSSVPAAPKIKPDKIHRPLNSSKTLSETQLNHLTNLNTSNAVKRKAKAATARAISAEMKLNRQKRNHSGATSAEDNDSSFSETEEETEEVAALKFSNLISTDIPAEPTKTPTTSFQIPTMPAFPTHTPLISRQIPVIHSQTSASLKSPEDVSKYTFYKRLKANRERAKNELGAGYRVTNSPEGKVSVEEAARFKVLKRLTDDQYTGLDSKHYPGLTSVKKYLKDLSKKLEDLEKDGLAQAIINHINSLEAFPRNLIRICIGIDKGSDTVKIVWFLVDLTDPLSPKKLKIFACILGEEKRECLMPYLDLIDEAVAFLQSGLIETKHGFKEFLWLVSVIND
uniref:Uncharacterized protein n=1 Tax=Panagrolaimus davidi TaxID=227884 RepID=A0A914QTA0_9BILA